MQSGPLNTEPNETRSESQQIHHLTRQLQQSKATRLDLSQKLQAFERQQKSLNGWWSKIPFILILLSFIAVGVASYVYPIRSGIDWIWHGTPTEISEHFMAPQEGETPPLVYTIAIWVGYAVLWQIFILVNVTDLTKYLHIYSSKRFRWLARLTIFTAVVGGCFMVWLCLHAGTLIESVATEAFQMKWLLTAIVMVVPLIGALMLSGGRPTPREG